jgi:gliding motility-associated lipoprotein GldH
MARIPRHREIIRTSSKLLSFLLSLTLLLSCDGRLFHSFRSIDGCAWDSKDTLEYHYEGSPLVSGTDGMELCFEARCSSAYRYEHLVVCAVTSDMNDSILSCDTLSVRVYDSTGRMCGATAGAFYQYSSEPVYIPVSSTDSVRIELTHLMKDSVLCGVNDVGIRLVGTCPHGQHQF